MNVLHVIPSLSLRRGGPSASLRQLAAAQIASGLKVGVLTTNDDCEVNSQFPLGQWFDLDGVPVMAFERRLSRHRWYREHIICPDAIRWLGEQLPQWQLLHVHAVFSYLSTRTMGLARRRNRPYICRPLGQLCNWSLAQKSIKKRLYLRLFERANLSHASCMHFTSEKERSEFRVLNIDVPDMVVPHGVDFPELPKANGSSDRLNVLSMSRIDGKKGLDLLIRAFALVAREMPAARLLVAGDGDPQCIADLRCLARDLKLDQQVEFTGWVTGEAKNELLREADLFALASHSENFGVAVVEAMAWSVPVLLTDGVALCDDVLDAGAGVQIGFDPKQIADCIVALGADPRRRAEMGRKARALVARRFVWSEIAERLLDRYQTIVTAHAR